MAHSPSWLIDLPECPSTNTWALEHADALAHGACVHTRRQTAGRGQPGSVWQAPPGVLTATFILRLPPSPAPWPLLAGLAVAHAVEDLMPGLALQVKWPNDCLLGGRKCAGILCERPQADGPFMAVGIGLNVDPRWGDAAGLDASPRFTPTSLAEHGPAPAISDLLAGLRRYLLEAAGLLSDGRWLSLLPSLRTRDALLGRALRLETAIGIRTGFGAGIDDGGRLLLRHGDTIEAIASARHVAIAE